MVARHEAALKRTARRYSLDSEDAEDAYQRALEIVLTKAPTTDARELIRWTQTVTKHEALAVRESRERLFRGRAPGNRPDGGMEDPAALIPAPADGPDERAERSEEMARSREALRALKPAELQALTLLAEGYSYSEIGERTGFSQTKVNRLLAEGRSRFRDLLSSSEDGTRCRELRPLLSAFCDGEAGATEVATVREHLRACARCRSTMRAYRAAPRIAVALAPVLPPSRSLAGRLRDLLGELSSRLPGLGGGSDSAAGVAVSGGSRGLGMAATAKLLALCAGAAGGAACVATGVLPTPLDLAAQHPLKPTIERSPVKPPEAPAGAGTEVDGAAPPPQAPDPKAHPDKAPQPPAEAADGETAGVAEYETPASPAPEPVAAPAPVASTEPEPSSPSSGSAAGEFGP
jgi:RNA polymerase sigma factor (sigma-70 family)